MSVHAWPSMTVADPALQQSDGARMRVGLPLWVAHSGALLLFTVLTLTRAWTLVTHPASTVTPTLIDPMHTIWALDASIQDIVHWRHGLWSFYDANIYFPTPHAAAYGDVFIGLLPLSLPLHLLIANPIALANMLLVLSFVLSAYGAFLLSYRLTGSFTAALLAGLVFGFCPLRTEQIDHLGVISTEWQVAAAYMLLRAWENGRRRWWVAAGICIGLAGVMNLYYAAYYTVPVVLIACFQCRQRTAQRIQGAALAVLLGVGILLAALLPYVMRHAEIGVSYGTAGSMDLLSFLQVLQGRPIDGSLFPTVSWQFMVPAHGLFPGLIPVALAYLAWRRRRGRVWGVFGLACALLALGSNLNIHGHIVPIPLPYAWLSAAIPGFHLFRDPSRAAMGLYLGLAVLAAFGAREALAWVAAPRRRALLGTALVAVTALELWSPLPVVTVPSIPQGEYWIARHAEIHVVAELPIANSTVVDWQRELEVMYDATAHERMLVNGSGSVEPVGMATRRTVLATYPAPASLRLLDALHVDALVLRRPWLTPQQWQAAMSRCNLVFEDDAEAICRSPWRPKSS